MKYTFFLLLISICLTNQAPAQPDQADKALHFKMEQLPDGSWGVYVKPAQQLAPSERTITGSGQVTIVAPKGFSYSDFTNYGGTWIENARVNSPKEAPSDAYISFGFVTDSPKIAFFPNEETLLFTFIAPEQLNGTFRLFENNTDPFVPSNSYESNPGNDIGVIDAGTGEGLRYYTYGGNYEEEAQARPVFSSQKKD